MKLKRKAVRIVCVLLLLFSLLLTSCASNGGHDDVTTEPQTRAPVTDPPVTEAPPSTDPTSPDPPETTPAPPVLFLYDYAQPVPVTADTKDRSWFDDAVFIGDSRTEGFIMFEGLVNATSYAYTSLNVDTVQTKAVVSTGGAELITIPDALRQTTGWNKVYIMFGVNELGWSNPENFILRYRQLIDTIRSINPDADLYVQSVIPVAKVNSGGAYVENSRVLLYNQLIREMCLEKELFYVNVAEVMSDAEGYLPEDAASDGIHPGRAYCGVWLDYLLTHTVTRVPVI